MQTFSVALLLPLLAYALPPFSWDTLPTYFHCANLSGPWNDAAVAAIARNKFAVFEKMTGMFSPPVNTSAESKIVDACKQVKGVNASVDCYMYTESDWARTWYTLGGTFDQHPEWELHQDAKPGSPLQNTTEEESDDSGMTHTYYFRAYDFSVPEAQAAWVARVTAAAASGFVDGAFIDGNRGGWGSTILAGTTPAHAAAWSQGLKAAHNTLASALGAKGTLISNCAPPPPRKREPVP
jgi:hypothetical protein